MIGLLHAPSWADFITAMVGFKVFGIGGPEECFPDLASFRQVDAESEMRFPKKMRPFRNRKAF
jgi:hypothetical protein